MSTLFGAIGEGINQDKGMLWGLVNNQIAYHQSGKQQRRAYLYAKKLQEQQYNLGIKGYKDSPSAMREGLTKAGYNPMLALGNVNSGVSVAGGTPVQANSTSSNSPDLTGSALDMQRLTNETQQTNSNIDVNNATSFKTRMEGIAQSLRNRFINDREKAEISRTLKEAYKLESDSLFNEASIQNMQRQLDLQRFLGMRGQNLQYNASKYATDVGAETARGTITTHNPFGLGSVSKYYQPDDTMRMPYKFHDKSYIDTNDRRYWHYY